LSISVTTIQELELGILSKERRDSEQGALLRRWFAEGVLAGFEGRIIPVDIAVARAAARLHVPDPRPERDAIIAATASVHSLEVVTRNVADFEPTGVLTINPWSA
jgi:predicted nucleic acid-binding protein